MKKIILFISFIVVILATPSCGDPEDTSAMYNWKDVAYAFNMVEEENSLKGLHVDITYVDQMAIERIYDYSGFERWDMIFSHLPWGFIPRMKATVIQPEDVVFEETDFPAVIHIVMGISDGDNLPHRLDKTETFETLSEFNKYIKSLEDKTYKVYPTSTEIGE
ncbi:MAG: hypothetical protein J6L02_03285 [Bacteroidales bacterium]|nr:hypothetical protein [Bacteroidales bacterium]